MSQTNHQHASEEALRRGMRHVPAVVTVVTLADSSGLKGITIGSFVSLSLDPPLICFNVNRSASIHDRIASAERFIVHVLREDQSNLSDSFATADLTGEEQFEDLDYETDEYGTPVLNDALVTFHCRRFAVHPGGDHSIVVGNVYRIEEGRPGRPVVYHQRAYHGVGEKVAERA